MDIEHSLHEAYCEQIDLENLKNSIYFLLENKDHYSKFINLNEEIIEEGFVQWFSDVGDILEVGLKTLVTTPAWLKELGEWLFSLGVSGVSGMLVAQVLSQILIFAIRKVVKRYQKEQNIRNDVKDNKFRKQMEKFENISDEDLLMMREQLEEEFDKKFPEKKKGYWATIIEIISNILKSSFGTYGMGIGFMYLFYMITGLPNYEEVYTNTTKDMGKKDIVQGVAKSMTRNVPIMSPIGLFR